MKKPDEWWWFLFCGPVNWVARLWRGDNIRTVKLGK